MSDDEPFDSDRWYATRTAPIREQLTPSQRDVSTKELTLARLRGERPDICVCGAFVLRSNQRWRISSLLRTHVFVEYACSEQCARSYAEHIPRTGRSATNVMVHPPGEEIPDGPLPHP